MVTTMSPQQQAYSGCSIYGSYGSYGPSQRDVPGRRPVVGGLVVLSTLSCREGTRVALLQALLLLVPGALEALEALEALNYWRP